MTDFFQSVRRDRHESVMVLKTLDDVNITNKEGENLLHVAIAYSNIDAAVELIQQGIDVNAQDRRGVTPLHYAGAHNIAEIAQLILDQGGDIEIADEHGNTPLWTAVFNARGKYDVVDVLLENGGIRVADRKNKLGRSPIDFATQIGDTELVKRMSSDS